MSKEVALGLLRQGNTGDEILQILDVIAEGFSTIIGNPPYASDVVDFNGNPTTI